MRVDMCINKTKETFFLLSILNFRTIHNQIFTKIYEQIFRKSSVNNSTNSINKKNI